MKASALALSPRASRSLSALIHPPNSNLIPPSSSLRLLSSSPLSRSAPAPTSTPQIIPLSPHAIHLAHEPPPSPSPPSLPSPIPPPASHLDPVSVSPHLRTPIPATSPDALAFSHPAHDDPSHPIFDPSLPAVNYLDVQGYVHSTESMGSLEGPGNRFLVFLTGCMCRCLYCENPDTWDVQKGGKLTPVSQLISHARRLLPYYTRSVGSGGVTVSGGDPLVQHDFLAAFLYAAKRELGLHTCVETTGLGTRRAVETVLPWTDLVLLCIKGTNPTTYSHITQTPSRSFSRLHAFISNLDERRIPWWCRYVVVPGLTDRETDVDELVEMINTRGKGCERVELLPYHTLGEHKWKELGLDYPLAGTPYPEKARLQAMAAKIKAGLDNKAISVYDGVE
ncbi:hypothetical protein HDU93_000631 [Gonapodya sp. JEL0774]|nr:hypothetical protein HDU93_000631 [Gonapodya sp. JEL0774]